MGGRASRQKGMRGEYLARDLFRSMGWEADRIPASGAAQGFKGDLRIRKAGVELTVEVKNERATYKSVYALLDRVGRGLPMLMVAGRSRALVSYNADDLRLLNDEYRPYAVYEKHKDPVSRAVVKIWKMSELLKGCAFLMVKNNNKPFVFIKYFTVSPENPWKS